MRRFLFLLLSMSLVCGEELETSPIATVAIFIAIDCPIANSYAPEINRIYGDYSAKGIKFQLVYPDPGLADEDWIQHAADYKLKPPGKVDRDHALVKQTGVATTPEAAVLDSDGDVVYRGLIDNRYADYGERRRHVTERYLRNALDAILKGDKPAVTRTEAIGCLIERLP